MTCNSIFIEFGMALSYNLQHEKKKNCQRFAKCIIMLLLHFNTKPPVCQGSKPAHSVWMCVCIYTLMCACSNSES